MTPADRDALLDAVRVGQAERLLALLDAAERYVKTAHAAAAASAVEQPFSAARCISALEHHARAVGTHAGITAAIATLIAAAALEKRS